MLNSEQRWRDIRTIFDDVLPDVTQTNEKPQKLAPTKKQAQQPKKKQTKKSTQKVA